MQVEAQADLLVRQPSGYRVGLVAVEEGGDRERQAERANRQHQHHIPLGKLDHGEIFAPETLVETLFLAAAQHSQNPRYAAGFLGIAVTL